MFPGANALIGQNLAAAAAAMARGLAAAGRHLRLPLDPQEPAPAKASLPRGPLVRPPRPMRPRIQRAYHRDRSRYTGAMLRALRAERGCGRPPKVIAARRAKALARATQAGGV